MAFCHCTGMKSYRRHPARFWWRRFTAIQLVLDDVLEKPDPNIAPRDSTKALSRSRHCIKLQ